MWGLSAATSAGLTLAYAARVEASAPPSMSLERAWWVRALAVLQSPTLVFRALRDESREAEEARQEPILAIAWLAGISLVLSTYVAGDVLDDFELDGISLAISAFLAGGIYALATYLFVGALVWAGLRLAGSAITYRHARHVLGFASVPIALSLLVWPVRIALYGEDLFRTAGDEGAGDVVFDVLLAAFVVWSVGLLVVGARVIHDWSWRRAAAAAILPAAVPALAFARGYGIL
jgi:hypothetical protein